MRYPFRFVLVLVSCLFCITAQAAPTVLLDGSGNWIGGRNISVDGADYNVDFIDGTCTAVFGACDEGHFAFTSFGPAHLAQLAIDDMASNSNFENNPSLIGGCDSSLFFTCGIITPFGNEIVSGVLVGQLATYFHFAGAPDAELQPLTPGDSPSSVWAKWSPAVAAPEPSTLASLSFGLLALFLGICRGKKVLRFQ